MAICYWDARIMWEAFLRGVSFENVVTMGHLSLYLYPSEVIYFKNQYASKHFGVDSHVFDGYKFGDYSDEFLSQFLGIRCLSVVDASSYEGAGIIHDFNTPIPSSLKNMFDVVLDCGTLEHIFNFPVAISNLMEMTRVGGRLIISSPSNNLCGHGFFQFSPELMFRIFTKKNGFKLTRIVLTEGVFPSVEMSPHRPAYEVVDPEDVKSRVGLINHGPVTMIVEAVKKENVPLFQTYPIQSDYVSLWRIDSQRVDRKVGIKHMLKPIYHKLPLMLKNIVSGLRQRRQYSFSNANYFKKLDG